MTSMWRRIRRWMRLCRISRIKRWMRWCRTSWNQTRTYKNNWTASLTCCSSKNNQLPISLANSLPILYSKHFFNHPRIIPSNKVQWYTSITQHRNHPPPSHSITTNCFWKTSSDSSNEGPTSRKSEWQYINLHIISHESHSII